MQFTKVPVSHRAASVCRAVERVANVGVRGVDSVLGRLHLGGRRADYDDQAYEFQGGARDELRRKHWDKSLRLLWKAQAHAPWSSFKDATTFERELAQQAERALSPEERRVVERFGTAEFRALLQREYTARERQALVNVLSAIGHGEAYAWLVSADLIGTVRGSGAKAAVAAQVMEEAKHFLVLRELVLAFGLPPARLTAWEYLLLESVLKTKGLEKFFGMNVLVEGIALSLFGALSHLPGLEVLRLFHLDEARHSALPMNYLREAPLSTWERVNPLQRLHRLRLVLPAVPLIFVLEEDLAELGVDVFEFGGSVMRKTAALAERAGFLLPLPLDEVVGALNLLFNAYCAATRPDHRWRDYRGAETTRGARELAVEREALAS